MSTSFGESIIQGLTELTETLERGEAISERYTCKRVMLDLDPTAYDGELVRKTRAILGASQAVFAKFLGVSVRTVQSWEQDKTVPRDMACRFMDEIRRDPKYWRARFIGTVVSKPARQKTTGES